MSEPALKELTGRIGKYDIIKPLGKGAMGIVYLAKDSMLDREVALKVMVSNIADDPELKMRFEREAKAVAKLSHPNVVNVFDLGYHTDGSPFMAMELLRGDDLQKTLRLGPMPLERKVSIIVQVLVGLAHAHQAGIVHRDIKPANIFIGNDGAVKIMDFGVARLTTASVTGTGAIVGTADYMSPEQVKGARVDGRSDLFSVGCMFYEMLVGKRPFHAENLMAIFFKITHDEPNWNAIPPGPEYDALTPILSKALAKDLSQRYENATQFALALRDYLATYGTSASAANRAIDDLVDLNAPTGTPAPLEDLLEDNDTDGTVDLSRGQAATRVGAAATMATGGSPTLAGATRVGATRAGTPTQAGGTRAGATRVQAPPRPQPAPVVESKSNTTVIAAGFVFLIVTVGGGGPGGFAGGRGGFGGGFGGPQKGQDVEYPLEIGFMEAYEGAERRVSFSLSDGTQRDLTIRIPKGIKTGARLRVAGRGADSRSGGSPGDLYVVMTVAPHPSFRRVDDDIETDLELKMSEALLGTSKELPTPEGSKKIKVPAGVTAGTKIRLKGLGFPVHGSKERGDLYAVVKFATPPKKLSKEQQEAALSLAEVGL